MSITTIKLSTAPSQTQKNIIAWAMDNEVFDKIPYFHRLLAEILKAHDNDLIKDLILDFMDYHDLSKEQYMFLKYNIFKLI